MSQHAGHSITDDAESMDNRRIHRQLCTSVSSCWRRANSASRFDLAVARASLVLSMATLSTMRAYTQTYQYQRALA